MAVGPTEVVSADLADHPWAADLLVPLGPIVPIVPLTGVVPREVEVASAVVEVVVVVVQVEARMELMVALLPRTIKDPLKAI